MDKPESSDVTSMRTVLSSHVRRQWDRWYAPYVAVFVLSVSLFWKTPDGRSSFIASHGQFLRVISNHDFLMAYAFAILVMSQLGGKARDHSHQRRRPGDEDPRS